MTTGLTSTRWLRIPDDTRPHGWRWQKRRAFSGTCDGAGWGARFWPQGGTAVDVAVVSPCVRTRSCCQVVIVRHSLSALLSHARFRASSDREVDTHTLLAPLSARWDREVLTASGNEKRGLDHSQIRSAQAQVARAGQVAPSGDQWRSPTRDPASSSSSRA
jgi:hypothetical protein